MPVMCGLVMNRMTLTKLPTALGLFCALVLLAACESKSTEPEPARPVRTLLVAPQTVDALTTYAGDVRARYESNDSHKTANGLGPVLRLGVISCLRK